MDAFLLAVLLVSVFSGATATVVGFGIGSLLTPLFSTRLELDLAVAAVILPHAAATAIRCFRLRRFIEWSIVRSFGLTSVAGALLGGYLYLHLTLSALREALGLLLLLTAVVELSGLTKRWRPQGVAVSLFGAISGLFGGMVGNQGGLRAAALVSFQLKPEQFVATATAIGLLVDAARLPAYAWKVGAELFPLAPLIVLATFGTITGTFFGEKILHRIPELWFRRAVAYSVGTLGMYFLLT